MIKVITSFVSCLAAILLGILALATDFWRVWWKEDKEIEGVQYHHEGLFQTCSETTVNGTVLAVDRCTDLHDLGRPGTLLNIQLHENTEISFGSFIWQMTSMLSDKLGNRAKFGSELLNDSIPYKLNELHQVTFS